MHGREEINVAVAFLDVHSLVDLHRQLRLAPAGGAPVEDTSSGSSSPFDAIFRLEAGIQIEFKRGAANFEGERRERKPAPASERSTVSSSIYKTNLRETVAFSLRKDRHRGGGFRNCLGGGSAGGARRPCIRVVGTQYTSVRYPVGIRMCV